MTLFPEQVYQYYKKSFRGQISYSQELHSAKGNYKKLKIYQLMILNFWLYELDKKW